MTSDVSVHKCYNDEDTNGSSSIINIGNGIVIFID
jgi:hypothetical protein